MRKARSDSDFLFVGNHPCLDFINTQMIQNGRLVDLLEGFSGLIVWLAQAGILDKTEAKEAIRRWGGQPEGRRVFEEGRAFRAVLRAMVERIVNGKPVHQSAVEAINRLLRTRLGYSRLMRVQGRFEKRFQAVSQEASHLLAPLAEFAGNLLCAGDLSLVKKCRNSACILYFYDSTKNHARHWCSMSICGNRMKVAAHYQRTRSGSDSR
ncbi:MAG: ABATE domain-containing protein [Nitrospirae bacterium]|nr:ABATE domain-containing protein [Nitrospirota bacterium]